MTRSGKMVRLPRTISGELNRRLDEGESGVCLLDWLNGQPDVQQVLTRQESRMDRLCWSLADGKVGHELE